eukprot:gene11758-biopygen3866
MRTVGHTANDVGGGGGGDGGDADHDSNSVVAKVVVYDSLLIGYDEDSEYPFADGDHIHD